MGLADFFNDITEAIKHNNRIKGDVNLIDSTANYQRQCIDAIRSDAENKGRDINLATKKGLEGWSGNAVKLFKENVKMGLS